MKGTRPSHPLSAYVGTYSHRAFGDVEVESRKGRLSLRFGPLQENFGPLAHWQYDSFRWRNGDGRHGETLTQFEQASDGASVH